MVPVPVDSCGLVVEALDRVEADALVLTPAHQYPTGAVLSGQRRADLLASLRARNSIAIEDDYDSEFRYDRAPVGALQGLDPERIVFAGTTSKTLAPALRLGWLVVPPVLREAVIQQQRLADFGQPRIEQHAFALFLSRGELDRHLRRMRARYRSRRDALVESLRRHVPEAAVCGIAAGLHATVRLPEDDDERAIQAEAKRRGVGVAKLSDYFLAGGSDAPTLVVAYARVNEATIEAGVKELAAAIEAVRRRAGSKVR
jgi:GntR family transcriptional regulator/MocR family aminotransferase